MAEIVDAIQDKDFFRKTTSMRAETFLRDSRKYCKYHRDHRHDTEQCRHPRSLIEELIKERKLKEFVAFGAATERQGKAQVGGATNDPVHTNAIHIVGYVPAIFRGSEPPRKAS